jgi:hypothetical protein
MAAKMEYIILCGQVVGSGPFTVEYSFDGRKFDDRAAAIRHGFKTGRSDDFNVGVLREGKLVSLDWMDQTVDADPGLMSEIEAQVLP